MSKPLAQEEDVLVFNEENGKRTYLYVYNTEEVVYEDRADWAGTNQVSTNTLGSAFQMDEIEPDRNVPPMTQIYQMRVGIQGPGLVYAEMMAGTHRRGVWKYPNPTSSNYYIGQLDSATSPYYDPRFEMFLRFNQYPAFAVYNPTKMKKVTVYLRFAGKKLRCYDMTDPASDGLCGLAPGTLAAKVAAIQAGQHVPHRAISPRGL